MPGGTPVQQQGDHHHLQDSGVCSGHAGQPEHPPLAKARPAANQKTRQNRADDARLRGHRVNLRLVVADLVPRSFARDMHMAHQMDRWRVIQSAHAQMSHPLLMLDCHHARAALAAKTHRGRSTHRSARIILARLAVLAQKLFARGDLDLGTLNASKRREGRAGKLAALRAMTEPGVLKLVRNYG